MTGANTQIKIATPVPAELETPAPQFNSIRSASSQNVPGRRLNPLASLWAHKRLAIVAMLLVWVAGVPLAWRMGDTTYYTETVIYVSPRFLKNLEADQEHELQSNSQYREFVQQQMKTVGRYDILLDMFKAHPELMTVWRRKGESDQRAVERLQAALVIKAVPDTYQFTIGLEGDRKEGIAELVNAVAEVFLEKDKKDELYGKDGRIQDLHEEQQRLTAELSTRMEERTVIAQELGVTTFNDSLLNPYDQLLINRKNELAHTRSQRIEKESELSAVAAPRPDGQQALAAQAREKALGDSGLNSLKANLNQRRSELLTRLSGLGPNHPGRKAAERELSELDEEIKQTTTRLSNDYAQMLVTQRESQVFQTRRTEQALGTEVKAQGEQAQWFAAKYQQALLLGVELDRIRKRLGAVDERINFLTLESQAPGFLRLFSAARTPELPLKGGKRKFLMMFLGAGLLLGVLIPVAVDLLDPRLHSADEVEKLLGFAPLGSVNKFDSDPSRRFTRDQLLRLASAIGRDHQMNGSRVFLFTAASSGAGTTTLVGELARKLNDLGVQTTSVTASELLVGAEHTIASTQSLRARLNALTAENDVLLLDAPPVLLSADAEVLAANANATVLVVAASRDTNARVKLAARRLERLQLPAVGVVVNGVDPAKDNVTAAMLVEYKTGRAATLPAWLSPWTWA